LEIVYFTIAGMFLYLGADWILNRIELAAGKRLERRSIIFFAILMTLALTSFALIRLYTGNP
jgi:hypothetical protein